MSAPVRNQRVDGTAAEDLAARFLENHGIRIVERNWRWRGGEIDLIGIEPPASGSATPPRVLFVEVKLRRSVRHGTPEEAVGYRKRATIAQAARAWLARTGGSDRPVRFDVVGIRPNRGEVPGGPGASETWGDADVTPPQGQGDGRTVVGVDADGKWRLRWTSGAFRPEF